MGCIKLSDDVKKHSVTMKLHPRTIKLIHDKANQRGVKFIRIVEECLSVLEK